MYLLNDERGLVVGWMAKLLLLFALLGILIYDAAALAVNGFQLDSFSDEIAISIALSEADDKHLFDLEREARKMARTKDAKFVSLEVDRELEQVRVTIRREAATLVINRFSQTSDWGRMSATGKSSTD
jgi:hypothetical protein